MLSGCLIVETGSLLVRGLVLVGDLLVGVELFIGGDLILDWELVLVLELSWGHGVVLLSGEWVLDCWMVLVRDVGDLVLVWELLVCPELVLGVQLISGMALFGVWESVICCWLPLVMWYLGALSKIGCIGHI